MFRTLHGDQSSKINEAAHPCDPCPLQMKRVD
jgi:hypothetical protein